MSCHPVGWFLLGFFSPAILLLAVAGLLTIVEFVLRQNSDR